MKELPFILVERLDFHITTSLTLTAHALHMRILTSLSVDEIVQPKSSNFIGLPFNEEMTSSWLQHINSDMKYFKIEYTRQ